MSESIQVYLYEMLKEVSTPNAEGVFPKFTCRYVCGDGHLSEITEAQFIRFDRNEHNIILRVPGGARTLKFYGIVGYEGADVFL